MSLELQTTRRTPFSSAISLILDLVVSPCGSANTGFSPLVPVHATFCSAPTFLSIIAIDATTLICYRWL